MKPAKLVLVFALAIPGARATQAEKAIELVRSRFVNSEVIKLNMQAQEEMQKWDLASAARTIELAMRKDPTLWLTCFMRARLFVRERKYELAIEDSNWIFANIHNLSKLPCCALTQTRIWEDMPIA